jgi:hypothetical protein
VHRHGDPITTHQAAESVVQRRTHHMFFTALWFNDLATALLVGGPVEE